MEKLNFDNGILIIKKEILDKNFFVDWSTRFVYDKKTLCMNTIEHTHFKTFDRLISHLGKMFISSKLLHFFDRLIYSKKVDHMLQIIFLLI
jgi:hypothetical protein